MAHNRYETRRKKLRKKLRAETIDALLVTNEINVKYLTGFTGDSSYLLLGRDGETFITDTRYAVQVEEECPGLATYTRDSSEKIDVSTGKVVKKSKLKTIGFESETTTHAMWLKLQKQAEGVAWMPTSELVEELRQVKDAGEIRETRQAVEQAERAFALLVAALHPDMTEREAAIELENAIRRFGGDGVAFDSIVAVGDRAALPHYYPGERQIKDAEFLLIDWGARVSSGYRSDLTRVVVTGKIRPKLERVYRVVLSAQKAAIRKMGPGVACKEVDAAARGAIDQAGFGKRFGHGLGHGIGLEIHEEPRMSPISEAVLKPGMIVTVEPGIYLPGWGGVRIEDDVLITSHGCEVLSSVPKELDEIPRA